MHRECVFDTFRNSHSQKIVGWRKHDWTSARPPNGQFVWFEISLRTAVGLQQRQMNRSDVARPAKYAGRRLVDETIGRDHCRVMLGLARRQER